MSAKALAKKPHVATAATYTRILAINGEHSLQSIQGACVEYAARYRPNAKIAYFNFELAKEMGLIAADHPEHLTPGLQTALIDTFSIQIINEHDIIHNRKFDPKDIKPNRYMATRYLQLQHPNRLGLTSGDGRSLWNGQTTYRGKTWDVSSCGTGATCLSPATAINKKFFRTGDPSISYGCGYSDLEDGIGNAVFSEILHKNGIATERTLLVLEYPNKLSINVRAGLNLLRPSHFFVHLKQENLVRLRGVVDLFIDRQLNNRTWPVLRGKENRYDALLTHATRTFAEMAARFESEYIFCWLDWDGDNILADGGIIDYGSIRQLGLYHHEYRYDDGDRWSTKLTEQKIKARDIVQTFAQMVDYLKTGRKKNLRRFKHCQAVKSFDRIFQNARLHFFLKRVGFTDEQAAALQKRHTTEVKKLYKHFTYFEETVNGRQATRTADGITRDAVFSMRDLLRDLPALYMEHAAPIANERFLELMRSSYTRRRHLKLTANKKRHIRGFQAKYRRLVLLAGRTTHTPEHNVLAIIAQRASLINRQERVTGDAMSHVQDRLLRNRKRLTFKQMQSVISEFINNQILDPDRPKNRRFIRIASPSPNTSKLSDKLQDIVKACREGL